MFNDNSAETGGAIYTDKLILTCTSQGLHLSTILLLVREERCIQHSLRQSSPWQTHHSLIGNTGPASTVTLHGFPFCKLSVEVYGFLIIQDNTGHGVWSADMYSANITVHTVVSNNTGSFSVIVIVSNIVMCCKNCSRVPTPYVHCSMVLLLCTL